MILTNWKKNIKPLNDSPTFSFTKWLTGALESAVLKQKICDSLYPDLAVVSTEPVFVIEDKRKKELVKVSVTEKGIESVPAGRDDCIMFACLHPLFQV
jgi:hypothetical protein